MNTDRTFDCPGPRLGVSCDGTLVPVGNTMREGVPWIQYRCDECGNTATYHPAVIEEAARLIDQETPNNG